MARCPGSIKTYAQAQHHEHDKGHRDTNEQTPRHVHRTLCRTMINDDGAACIAPHPLVWSVGGPPKKRRVVHAIRDAALPPPFWESGWVGVPASVTANDVSLCGRILFGFWSSL